jgi:DNA-binding response OmpR family regulator
LGVRKVTYTREYNVQELQESARTAPRGTFNLTVVSPSLLVRQAVARRIAYLGVAVSEIPDLEHLPGVLQSSDVDVTLIDGDGWQREWKSLIADLKSLSALSRVVLLVSSMSLEQTLDAASVGVQSVFLKPFREDVHLERILDLLLAVRGISAKRRQPRFTPERSQPVFLDYLPEDDWVVLRFAVTDVCPKGARLLLPYAGVAPELTPGKKGALATLVMAAGKAGVFFRVIHRCPDAIGISFEQFGAGAKTFSAYVDGLNDRTFGIAHRKREW